jgi:TPR repeat protein
MSISRIAGLFLTVAVSALTPGSATAGWDEGVAAYQRGDYHAAFREFMALASMGIPSAQYNLGLMYSRGQGVPQDYGEAVRWFRMAADQGDADAQTSLGGMYVLGQGVPQNDVEAVRWYRMAAEQGRALAQLVLGSMYAYGEGVPQDYGEAARWYQLAADQGEASAQYSLGLAYREGRGVVQDDATAARWYRLAAEQGHAGAQLQLGLMHATGEGVPQDDVRAYTWANLAAARSADETERKLSAKLRDLVATQLTPVQRARGQELARNWRPASQSVSGAASPPRLLSDEEFFGKSAALKGVQTNLAALGYDPGPADGVMGRRTRAAIRAFQADVGLPVDGQVSDQLIAALSDAGANGRSATAHTAVADPGSEGTGAKPWERHTKQRRLESTGTGFAVSQNGEIVTNHHVVADCADVRVRPPGQEALAGAVVVRDPRNDLALLRVPVHLAAAALRDNPGIRAGDSVVAVGFPLPGLLASEANVTTGTVSALAGIGNDTRFLQMTVPVQSGNSGARCSTSKAGSWASWSASSTRSSWRALRATSRRT